jgi:hypothetical protein
MLMRTTEKPQSTNLFGLGLRAPHYQFLITKPKTTVGWFEIISENFFKTKGRPRKILESIREDYPISCHGVSLSIGSYEDFDWQYLKDMKAFYQEIEPFQVSDHLCFTGLSNNVLHNLLPIAFNIENLNHLKERIDCVQNYLGRTLAFENLSAYFDYKNSTMSEWDFINELTKACQCDLLLDLNNIYVNSQNLAFDPTVYLEAINLDRVKEIHMAGFSTHNGFCFDTHSHPLYPELIKLYQWVLEKKSDIPVLFEWDDCIPEFQILEQQIIELREVWENSKNETSRL